MIIDRFCCINCFSEVEIRAFIESEDSIGGCDYCGSKDVYICNARDVGIFIMEGIERYYEDAANQVSYESAEGGYLLPTSDIADILIEEEDIFSDLLDDPYALLDDLVENDLTPYVRKDPYGPPSGDPEEIRYWENYCNIIKTKQRFTTFLSQGESDRYDFSSPRNFLFHLSTNYIPSLISVVRTGTQVYRARIKKGNKPFGHRDLTSPPAEVSKSNRMSPAGISFFYGSMDPETCIHEVRPDIGETVTVGKFGVLTKLFIVDFTYEIKKHKSIFNPEYVFSYEEYFKPFLSHFVNDISKPIRRSDNEIEYTPTQVFTEFLKNINFKDKYLYPDDKGEALDVFISGILFKSSMKKDGKNIVFFKGPDISTKTKQGDRDQWLSYKRSKNYIVEEIIVNSEPIV